MRPRERRAIGDDLRTRIDRALGERVGYAFKNHHRRRLSRVGWQHALDAPPGGWASGEPAPRPGNAVELLVDGADYLPRLADAIRNAESHVHVTGWFFSPEFALERGERPTVLRNLLAEAAERVDVRVLAWAGAPLPLLTPWRGDVREVRDRLTRGTGIRCALDDRERPMHCHHEKTVVIDDRVAFVGGIDLTLLEGDRFDTSEHRARGALGWHDTAVRIEGPALADVSDNFRLRWREVTGESLPTASPPPAAGDVELQVVRTVPEHVYDGIEHGEFRVLESYVRAFKAAQRLIYVETQYLWSPELTDVLAGKLREPPSDEFRVLFVLPAHPTHGGDNTRGVLAELVDADDGAGRVLACTLYARAHQASDAIYVHSKACVIDDEWVTIGSANLNDHSLFNDTELNVVSHDPELARRTRLRLWEEHLEGDADGDPTRVIDERWRPIAEEQLQRRRRGEPPTHRLCELPRISRRSARLLGPLQGLLVDG